MYYSWLATNGTQALIIALEHRYYGTTTAPTADYTTAASWPLLTSSQALADLANFITWLKEVGDQ